MVERIDLHLSEVRGRVMSWISGVCLFLGFRFLVYVPKGWGGLGPSLFLSFVVGGGVRKGSGKVALGDDLCSPYLSFSQVKKTQCFKHGTENMAEVHMPGQSHMGLRFRRPTLRKVQRNISVMLVFCLLVCLCFFVFFLGGGQAFANKATQWML